MSGYESAGPTAVDRQSRDVDREENLKMSAATTGASDDMHPSSSVEAEQEETQPNFKLQDAGIELVKLLIELECELLQKHDYPTVFNPAQPRWNLWTRFSATNELKKKLDASLEKLIIVELELKRSMKRGLTPRQVESLKDIESRITKLQEKFEKHEDLLGRDLKAAAVMCITSALLVYLVFCQESMILSVVIGGTVYLLCFKLLWIYSDRHMTHTLPEKDAVEPSGDQASDDQVGEEQKSNTVEIREVRRALSKIFSYIERRGMMEVQVFRTVSQYGFTKLGISTALHFLVIYCLLWALGIAPSTSFGWRAFFVFVMEVQILVFALWA